MANNDENIDKEVLSYINRASNVLEGTIDPYDSLRMLLIIEVAKMIQIEEERW